MVFHWLGLVPPWLCGKGKPQPQATEPRRGVRGFTGNKPLLLILQPFGEQSSVFTAPGHMVTQNRRAGKDIYNLRGLTSAWAHGAAGGRPETKAGEKNGLLEGTSPAWNTWEGGERYRYRCLSSLDLTVHQPSSLNLQALALLSELRYPGSSLPPQTQGSSL